MNRYIFLLLLVLTTFQWVKAQQPEIYNQFYMNPYLYNPAYAGVEGHSVIFVLYHQQWASIEGAPTLYHGSFHTPLKGGIGFGAMAFSLQEGPITKSIGKVSGSYLISFDKKHHLRLGMSVGGGSQSLNFNELDDPTDPAFAAIAPSSSFLVADFGATYHFDHFNVGFSIPNLVSYDYFPTVEGFGSTRVQPLDNVMVKINYRGHINHDIAIEPHLIYRYSNVLPSQFEATTIFHIFHQVWAAATYRQDNNIAISGGVKVKEKMAIGYAFETGNLGVISQLGPTHEIHIGIHMGTKKEHASHTSSFIKSHQLDAKQRAALAAKEREEKLKQLQQSRTAAQSNKTSSDELSIAKPTSSSSTTPSNNVTTTPTNENTTNPQTNSSQKQDNSNIKNNQTSSQKENIVNTDSTQPSESIEKEETGWQPSNETATRTNEFGEKEKAVVIYRVNAEGKTEKIVAWIPQDENWKIASNAEPPLERTTSSGQKEAGIRYTRTDASGKQQTIIKWEPIVDTNTADLLLKSDNLQESLSTLRQTQNTSTPSTSTQILNTLSSEKETIKTPEKSNITTPINTAPTSTLVTPSTINNNSSKPAQNIDDHPELKRIDRTLTNDFRTHDELATSKQHLEVTRGKNLLELPVGSYVVAGAFDDFDTAEDYSDKLFNKGYHDTIVGYLSAKGFYYVVLERLDSLEKAQKDKEVIKKRPGMEKVWVLRVN